MNNLGFKLYLLFAASWFLHLTARLPILGMIRFDYILVLIIIGIIFYNFLVKKIQYEFTHTDKILLILFLYILLSLPFIEWPGSVIRNNLILFVKAVVFYYFTIFFLNTENKLKIFMISFLFFQIFRVLEPLYLHVTEDYWGSVAYMSQGEEYIERLSGSPYDIINPNGLAFVIVTIIPIFHFLAKRSWKIRLLYILVLPLLLYALILTNSRSGVLALLISLIFIILNSKHKILFVTFLVLTVVIIFSKLSTDQKDRYLSIIVSNTKNAETAHGRLVGITESFKIALRRPLFGHGLGTSMETNGNFGNSYQPAHNLYAEIVQEIGFIGLIIYIFLLISIIKNFKSTLNNIEISNFPDKSFLYLLTKGLKIWFFMNILFSFFSYGLSSYEWYLFGGLSLVLYRISNKELLNGIEIDNSIVMENRY